MKEGFRKLLCDIAALTKSDISLDIIQIYLLKFQSIGYDVGINGLYRWLDEFDEKSIFPSVKKIAALGGSPIPEAPKGDDIGIALAENILAAVSRFGMSYSQKDEEKVRERLGEVGWRVVQLRGGWNRVCQDSDEPAIFKAQMRDVANAVARSISTGNTENNPRLARTHLILIDNRVTVEPGSQLN